MTTAFAPAAINCARFPDGAIELRSRQPLSPTSPTVLHWLKHWALTSPDAPFITTASECGREAWSYGAAWHEVGRLARAFSTHRIAGERLVVLASNSVEHLTVGMATMLAGGIYVPMAPQYAGGTRASKLRDLISLLRPSFAYIEDAGHEQTFRAAGGQGSLVLQPGTALESLSNGSEAPAEPEQLLARLDPVAVTKILLTSGSTGRPKPVAFTQARMTMNTQAMLDVWPFIAERKPELVDWLPWNHAFGGNANINLVLSQGGTLHVDESAGRPERLETTIANLRTLRPTYHGTVPAGFAALLPVLEGDGDFREAFFGRLDAMFTAGAGIHPVVHRRLTDASILVRGVAVPILSGWGSTETGPGATMVHVRDAPAGCIGLPLPGVDLRLEPRGTKYELLVRGHGVSDGYWSMPEVSQAFRSDGYFETGDAGELIDPDAPERGLRFAGRIADDFKLSNGTWVDANGVRERLLQLSRGRLRDVVVAGADRPALIILAWGAVTQDQLDALIDEYNFECGGNSRRVCTGALFDTEPEPNEVSQKGQLIREAVLTRRASLVDEMYEDASDLTATKGS
jgi:feruloyl-CoA synthase